MYYRAVQDFAITLSQAEHENLMADAVSSPNYSGSVGFGESSVRTLLGNCGTLDVQDCMATVRNLVDIGISVEGKGKQFLIGGSHGGCLTAHLPPDRYFNEWSIDYLIYSSPKWFPAAADGNRSLPRRRTPAESQRIFSLSPIAYVDAVKVQGTSTSRSVTLSGTVVASSPSGVTPLTGSTSAPIPTLTDTDLPLPSVSGSGAPIIPVPDQAIFTTCLAFLATPTEIATSTPTFTDSGSPTASSSVVLPSESFTARELSGSGKWDSFRTIQYTWVLLSAIAQLSLSSGEKPNQLSAGKQLTIVPVSNAVDVPDTTTISFTSTRGTTLPPKTPSNTSPATDSPIQIQTTPSLTSTDPSISTTQTPTSTATGTGVGVASLVAPSKSSVG
ncbi:hypothetical protein DFH09DRAFT_1320214 [Mycena vulgaris]|nr:hypothetical protein DFH09DRAFT_1320214 [Mycena vulgaris]